MNDRSNGRRTRCAGLLLVALVGLTACGSDASDDAVGTASTTLAPTTSTTSTPTSTPSAPPAPSSTVAPPETEDSSPPAAVSPPWDFTFSEVDGLVAVDTPRAVSTPVGDETTTLWASVDGVTDGYVTLRDVAAGTAPSPEGDVTAEPLDVATGTAWLVTDNVPTEPPPSSANRVMWWRDDGRVWIVSNHGLAAEVLTDLALAIEIAPDGSHTLDDPSITLVGTADLDAYESMTQAWTLDGHNLNLAVTNGGLAQQLSDVPVDRIVEQTIAGHPGYALTLPNGQVNLIWPTDQPGWWASVSSEPILADRATELAAAIVPS